MLKKLKSAVIAPFMRTTVERIKANLLLRRLLIVTWHILGIYLTYVAAYQLRFDGRVPVDYRVVCWSTLPMLLVISLLVFALFDLYSGMWSYFSVDDLMRMIGALITATLIFSTTALLFTRMAGVGFPRSVIVVQFLLMGAWMTGGRFATRYMRERLIGAELEPDGGQRLLIVGKVSDVDLVLRSTRFSGIGRPVAIITDQQTDRGLTLHGVRIAGTIEQIGAIAKSKRPSCIIILPPFNRPREIDRIVSQCSEHGVACTFRTLPSLSDLASGHITASSLREVDIEDLLGRGTVRLDRTEVRQFIKGKRVMVTGAGGSIGSELCRQLAAYEPAVLVLFEISEYGLYAIQQDLSEKYPNLAQLAIAGDIRHPEEVTAAIAAAGGIDVIFHAAAYKHVPLMETNVAAAFRTNVLGTARLAQVAVQHNVDKFVLISSDKAVRPSSIMGATKRIAERVINELPSGTTTFVSVRFGNVLGSSGSVIPLFKKQIAAGGPVTVTTPTVRRFFMTIPEAVDLVLLAGTVGRHREIMVLEMGQSIRIVDLARRLIELSGLIPDKDIPIRFIGLRPGEKEYEEVMTDDENVVRTAHDRIWVMKKTTPETLPPPIDLAVVEKYVQANDTGALRRLAAELVPENRF